MYVKYVLIIIDLIFINIRDIHNNKLLNYNRMITSKYALKENLNDILIEIITINVQGDCDEILCDIKQHNLTRCFLI